MINLSRAEDIIRKVVKKTYGSRRFYLHYADDSSKKIGHTFKIHRSAGMSDIWNEIQKELKKDGQTWYPSVRFYSKINEKTGKKETVQSDWIGIRSMRLNKKR